MSESIVVNRFPIASDECRNQQEKSALRLMEIGNQGLHYAKAKSWNNDYARTGDEFVESVPFEPRNDCVNRFCEGICIFPFIWFPCTPI